jgi:riboflavin synthase
VEDVGGSGRRRRAALMFTGIIEAVGRVAGSEPRGGDRRFRIDAAALGPADVALGDSIAVSGCCLTVVARSGDVLAFDVSNESVARTTLGALRPGDRVNLEQALRLADRLGGHLVSGHVDDVGHVVAIAPDARSQRWTIEAPAALARYIAAKGSIAVDGVSLTVNAVQGARFGVNLIPHTVAHTTFADRRVGDAVNLEVDLVARYVERLSRCGETGPHPDPPPRAGEGVPAREDSDAANSLPPLAGEGARRAKGGPPPITGRLAPSRSDGGERVRRTGHTPKGARP